MRTRNIRRCEGNNTNEQRRWQSITPALCCSHSTVVHHRYSYSAHIPLSGHREVYIGMRPHCFEWGHTGSRVGSFYWCGSALRHNRVFVDTTMTPFVVAACRGANVLVRARCYDSAGGAQISSIAAVHCRRSWSVDLLFPLPHSINLPPAWSPPQGGALSC